MKKLKTTTKEFVETLFDFTVEVCTKLDDMDQKLDHVIDRLKSGSPSAMRCTAGETPHSAGVT